MSHTVLVSAGHSTVRPIQPGASANGYVESHLTLELRDLVVPIVRARGVECKTDGAEGVNDTLPSAIRLARTVPIALEIHFNVGVPDQSTGCEGIGHPNRRAFAQELSRAVTAAAAIPLLGRIGYILPGQSQHARLGFCDAGGVILEICFITNRAEMDIYQAAKATIAEAIANVMVRRANLDEPFDELVGEANGVVGAALGITNRRLTRPTRGVVPGRAPTTRRSRPRGVQR